MNTVYVVLTNTKLASIHLTEAGARDNVETYVKLSPRYKEVLKNRWEWEDFSIMIEERPLHE